MHNMNKVQILELSQHDDDRSISFLTMVWMDMYDFSENSIRLVYSHEYHDSKEYIQDYDGFASKYFGWGIEKRFRLNYCYKNIGVLYHNGICDYCRYIVKRGAA